MSFFYLAARFVHSSAMTCHYATCLYTCMQDLAALVLPHHAASAVRARKVRAAAAAAAQPAAGATAADPYHEYGFIRKRIMHKLHKALKVHAERWVVPTDSSRRGREIFDALLQMEQELLSQQWQRDQRESASTGGYSNQEDSSSSSSRGSSSRGSGSSSRGSGSGSGNEGDGFVPLMHLMPIGTSDGAALAVGASDGTNALAVSRGVSVGRGGGGAPAHQAGKDGGRPSHKHSVYDNIAPYEVGGMLQVNYTAVDFAVYSNHAALQGQLLSLEDCALREWLVIRQEVLRNLTAG